MPAKHRNVRCKRPAAASARARQGCSFFFFNRKPGSPDLRLIISEARRDTGACHQSFPKGRRSGSRTVNPWSLKSPEADEWSITTGVHQFSFARGVTVAHRIVNPRGLGAIPSGRAIFPPSVAQQQSARPIIERPRARLLPEGLFSQIHSAWVAETDQRAAEVGERSGRGPRSVTNTGRDFSIPVV